MEDWASETNTEKRKQKIYEQLQGNVANNTAKFFAFLQI